MSGPSSIVLNAGAGGASLGVDDVLGVEYQVIKLGYSDSGQAPVQIGPSNPLPVTVGNFPASQAVTGTFWQATQPVSAAALPLPSGAATSALQTAINTTLGTPMQQTGGSVTLTGAPAISGTVTANQGGAPWTVKPDGTSWAFVGTAASVNLSNASVAITAASLPLPTGAALDTSVNGLLVASGAASASQPGPLVMGLAQGAAPTLTALTVNPLSMTLTGALRTSCLGPTASGTSAANSPVSIGGRFDSVPATVVSGNIVSGQYSSRGSLVAVLGDGNNMAAIKGASSPPVAADPALAVSVSPNSNVVFETGGNAQLTQELLSQILAELRIHSALLAHAFNIPDNDLPALRADPTLIN